jgi:hypothetical protein
MNGKGSQANLIQRASSAAGSLKSNEGSVYTAGLKRAIDVY